MINDEYIIKEFTSNGKIISKYRNKINKEIEQYLENRFEDKDKTIRETLCRILHNIEVKPICPICGNYCKFIGKKDRIYSKTCGNKDCISKHIKNEVERVVQDKYGVNNVFKLEEIKQKIRQTNLERYNTEYAAQNEEVKQKIKQTNLNKYGVDYALKSKEIRNKIRQTNLERYGVDCTLKLEEVKQKIRHTNLDRYNTEYVTQNEDIKEKIRQTNLERYGVNCTLKSEEVKQKIIQTNLERYNTEYITQNEEIKQKIIKTNLDRYGVDCVLKSEEVRNKIRHTNLERYGIENAGGSKESILKIKNTKFERYGDENYNNVDKAKKTCKERYGNENYNNIEKSKQTCIDKYGVEYVFQSKDVKEKIVNTNMIKYNIDNHMKTDYYRNLMSEIISSPKVQEKINNTKRKNKSFNKSKIEDECFELLVKKYYIVKRQYISKVYPFACDFYIPSIDLYIEFNGSQYHCGHPYDKDNKSDIELLNKLKEKSISSKRHKDGKKSQYDMMIYTWTDLDVRKRNIAKENNLNYIEFWNIKEVETWLETH